MRDKPQMMTLAILFCLLVAYVTSYALNVHRGRGPFIIRLAGHYEEGQQIPISASYEFGGQWAEMIYSPLLSVDRHVRHQYWTFTFHTNAF